MKKTASVILVVLSMLLVSVSFAFGEGKSEGAKQSGPVTITIWDFKYGDVANVQPAMKKIDDLIMQQNPDIIIDHVAQSNDNYYQVVRAAVQAGEGPDIIMFHGGVQAYEFDDFTLPLDQYISSWRSEISEYSWSFCSEGGVAGKPVHLVPLTIQGFGIYYNKDKFKQAGLDPENPPKDLAAFLAACDKLQQAGIVPITAGFQGGPFTLDFMMRTFVANIYGPDAKDLTTGKQNFAGNAAFLEAVRAIKTMFDKGYFSEDGTSTPYFVDAINNYSAGKGAMFVGLLSDIGHWKNFDDALGKDNIGYFPVINLPGAKYKDLQVLQPTGIGYSVMSWSKNPAQAAKLLKDMPVVKEM